MNSRKAIYLILKDIGENNLISDKVINEHLKELDLDKRDDNFIRKNVYGVLENKILLDHYIVTLTSRALESFEEPVLIIIRSALYQIKFLDKVPDSAAVNEAVNLTKTINERAKGFVNGVLRNFIRKQDELEIDKKDYKKYLSIKYSYPMWMVKYFIKELGVKKTEEILKFNSSAPELTIRVNTLKATRDELISKLEKVDIECRPSELTKAGIIISKLNKNKIDKLDLFKKGYFYIQDDASIIVAEIVNPKEDEIVLDVCSAPGGKTTHMAQLMNNKGTIVARDVARSKLNFVEENIDRLGIDIIETEVFDATNEDFENIEAFDKILVDAPCSGLGIIRRKPDIKYNRQFDDISLVSELQIKILSESAKLLKKNGILVYSTCTIGKKENEDIIDEFLSENKDFEIVPVNGKYTIRLLPGDEGTDGFFITKLKKK